MRNAVQKNGSPAIKSMRWILLAAIFLPPLLSAQRPRKTELWIDSIPADSVRCGGLTVQFARFFRDADEVKLTKADVKASGKQAIDIWVSNHSDSSRSYDPHMFSALNKDGGQINFWSAQEIGAYVGGRGFFMEASNARERDIQRGTREREQREVEARPEYAGGRLLPGASGGRRILVPDIDKNLSDGVTLYCGDTRLGLLSKPRGH